MPACGGSGVQARYGFADDHNVAVLHDHLPLRDETLECFGRILG
jgi:hypothetical protein